MFTIRSAQMDALRKNMEDLHKQTVDEFITRVVAHVREYFPEQCAALGEKNTRDMARQGIEAANTHGIDTEYGVCLFIDLMFIFGAKFAEDPELPWAQAILADQSLNRHEKPELLWAAAIDELEKQFPDQS